MSSDRYEIRGKIGQGGVGAVYRAYDTQLRREVAMKRVLQEGEMNSEDATANLLKEATALSSVQHPHIVTVYDAGIDGEGPYVVMELINGKTLDEMVERGTLTFEDFKEVAVQSQEAMIAAQDLNLVHRDLKPSNVMVSWLPSGRFQVKIVDFGLAKFSAKPSLQTIDHGDAVFGSIFFMAPEQFERTPLDCRTDMYSLGAMYYYALTGDYPFNGDTAPQVMASHLQNKVTPLIEVRPDLPPWLCEWVMWHIRRDMNDRPDSARTSLEHFLTHDSAHTYGITASNNLQQAQPVQAQGYAGGPPITGGQPIATAGTAPQPILSPDGRVNPHTARHQLVTGAITSQLNTGLVPNTGLVQNTPNIGQTAAVPHAAPAPNTAPVQHAAPVANPMATAPAAAVPSHTTTHQAAATMPVQSSEQPDQLTGLVAPPVKAPRLKLPHYIIIGAILVGTIIVVSIITTKKVGENRINENIEKYVAQLDRKNPTKQVTVEEKDVSLLLDVIAGKIAAPDKTHPKNILCVAKAADSSYNVDEMIGEYITQSGVSDNTRQTLLKDVLRRRTAAITKSRTQAFDALIPWIVENPNNPSTTAAVESIRGYANDGSDFSNILSVSQATTNKSVEGACANVLKDIVKNSKNKGSLVNQISSAYSKTKSGEKKRLFITAVSAAGTKSALDLIAKGVNSDDIQLVRHSLRSIKDWPNADRSAYDLVMAKVKNTQANNEEDLSRRNAFRSDGITTIMHLLRYTPLEKSSNVTELWRELVQNAINDSERYQILNVLGVTAEAWAIGLAQQIKEDARKEAIKKRADAAVINIQDLIKKKKPK